jgi:hypothetical protein
MKKLDIPCGEGNMAVIMNQSEMKLISNFLHSEATFKWASAHCAEAMEKEFNLAAGIVREPEKPTADTELTDAPF